MSDLKEAIKRLAKTNTGFDAILELAIVKSINKANMTCNVVLNDNKDLLLEGVKIKPVVPGIDLSAMGVVTYPSVGSYVIIGQINNSDADLFIVSCSKVDSIMIDAGLLFKFLLDLQTGSLALTIPSISFNGGKMGGMLMANPVLSKFNALEDKLNGLISDFKTHKHAGVAPGGSVTSIPDKISITTLVKTELNDIENKSIKQ